MRFKTPKLQQHKFYVYHDGATVYARKEDLDPVVVKECATDQEAHDFVQSVLNPEGRAPQYYGPLGFVSPEYQQQISPNCEKVVTEAYSKAA